MILENEDFFLFEDGPANEDVGQRFSYEISGSWTHQQIVEPWILLMSAYSSSLI